MVALAFSFAAAPSAQAQDTALVASAAGSVVGGVARRTAASHVRPGDRIVLHFLRDRELSETVEVTERGEVPLPKLGIVRVTHMRIGELQDTLRARYAEYLRAPEIEISVLRRVVVNGEVKIPNVYLVDASSTIRDAIARAGGFTEMANRNDVSVLREGRRIHVKNWNSDQGPATDIQSGDEILVGRKSWLAVNSLSVISTAVLVTSFIVSVARR
jgi:protein involved in polysaccharide export with SLBB domain